MSQPPTIDDLLDLHGQIEESLKTPRPLWVGGLSCIGLGMTERSRADSIRYDDTPSNCIPFAQTGGAGCHFSLLAGLADSPVVLTVPSNQGNWIVGANLWDFLSLGCHLGYFGLEQLEYDKAGTLREYVNEDDSPSGEAHQIEVLNILKSRYALEPWRDRKRFSALQRRFKSKLQFD